MKRVLQFIDNLEAGGKERQCVELVKVLSARGDFQIQVVCMRAEVFFNELFELPRVEVRFLLRKTRRDPMVFLRFINLCRELKPDVITVWDPMTAIYAIPAAKLLGIKFVSAMTQEAPLRISRRRSWLTRIVFAAADVVVANSRAGLLAFRAPTGKSVVIHAGYDLARAARPADREQTKQRFAVTQPLVVGMVAAFADRKDHPTFIRAAQLILQERRDVAFVMVGNGPSLGECRAMVAEPERAHIRFLGQVNGRIEDVANMFDVGVLATFTEGISNSIMEYMVLEKPVVATNGGGTSELVGEGQTGFLVEAGNAGQLAARIMTLLNDEDLRNRMGKSGRQRIELAFVLQETVQRFCDLYDRLLPSKTARRS